MALPPFNSQGDLPEGMHKAMIANDEQLKGARSRITQFEDLLAQMRVAAAPELFPSMASGYRAEIEKMQREVLEYLTRHVSEPTAAKVA